MVTSCVAAAVVILYANRSGGFFYDEWIWFSGASHADLSTLFQADNGHLVLVPRLIYQGILEVFGTDYLTFRLVGVALVLANSIMLFVLARRLVGDWLALAPAVLMMFFGSGWDVLVAAVGINVNLATACGLGAFLALQRRTLPADILAGLLVLVGFASFSGELAIAIGCIVLLVLDGRWRRAWVIVVPILLFAIWRLQSEASAAESTSVDQLGALPISLYDSVAAAMAGVTGMFPPGFASSLPNIDLLFGRPLAAVAIVGLGYLLLKTQRVRPGFVAYATVVVVFWLMIGLAGRDPSLGRYNVAALPFVFLALFELLGGRRLNGRHWAGVGIVLGCALLANLVALRDGAAILRYQAARNQAAVAALELQARRAQSPAVGRHSISELATKEGVVDSDMIYITPNEYFPAAERFGSTSYAPSELATAPEYAREFADRLLYSILRVTLQAPPGGVNRGSNGCRMLSATDPASIPVPPGGLVFRASGAEAQLALRRFADLSTVPPLVISPHSAGLLSIPGDRVPRPWTVEVNSATPVLTCPATGS